MSISPRRRSICFLQFPVEWIAVFYRTNTARCYPVGILYVKLPLKHSIGNYVNQACCLLQLIHYYKTFLLTLQYFCKLEHFPFVYLFSFPSQDEQNKVDYLKYYRSAFWKKTQFSPSMDLQIKWSIKVTVFQSKLYRVDRVNLGNNPFVMNISKYFWNLIRSIFFLKTALLSLFLVLYIYIYAKIMLFFSPSWSISINKLSHNSECLGNWRSV